jgi:hypothetical protein
MTTIDDVRANLEEVRAMVTYGMEEISRLEAKLAEMSDAEITPKVKKIEKENPVDRAFREAREADEAAKEAEKKRFDDNVREFEEPIFKEGKNGLRRFYDVLVNYTLGKMTKRRDSAGYYWSVALTQYGWDNSCYKRVEIPTKELVSCGVSAGIDRTVFSSNAVCPEPLDRSHRVTIAMRFVVRALETFSTPKLTMEVAYGDTPGYEPGHNVKCFVLNCRTWSK